MHLLKGILKEVGEGYRERSGYVGKTRIRVKLKSRRDFMLMIIIKWADTNKIKAAGYY